MRAYHTKWNPRGEKSRDVKWIETAYYLTNKQNAKHISQLYSFTKVSIQFTSLDIRLYERKLCMIKSTSFEVARTRIIINRNLWLVQFLFFLNIKSTFSTEFCSKKKFHQTPWCQNVWMPFHLFFMCDEFFAKMWKDLSWNVYLRLGFFVWIFRHQFI